MCRRRRPVIAEPLSAFYKRDLVMLLSRFEKLVYLGCPWLFGMVLIVCGLVVTGKGSGGIQGLMLICSGLIAMSIFCLCALVAKAVPGNRAETHAPQITSA